jgi:O-antigen/teichoic acid export membrane protein
MPADNQASQIASATARPSRERSARAAFWALVDLAGGQGSSFFVFLVLARVIGPAQYGVFALAWSLLGLITIIQYYGFADAIVQRAEVDESFLDTVFWCDLALALVLIVVAQATALPVARLFGAPLLEPVIRALSLICLLQALVTVPTALCRRALQLQVFAARTLLSYAVGGIVGIAMALRGYGVWALVASQLAQYVVILLVMAWRFPWRPGLRVCGTALRELVSFAGHFMIGNGIKLSADRVSPLVVGLYADAESVGCYALALRILLTAIVLTNSPIERVTLPVLSRFARDLPSFRETYRKMVLVVNSLWMPVATGLGATAAVLLPPLFGARWAAAGPVLQAMCFTAPTLGLWYLSGQALAALGKPERFTRLALAYAVLVCASFAISARFGIVAAGWTWAGLSVLMVPLHLRAIQRASGLPIRLILSDWSRVTASAGVMLVVVIGVRDQLQEGIASAGIALAAGVASYLLLLELVLLPGHLGRMLALVRNKARPAGVVVARKEAA